LESALALVTAIALIALAIFAVFLCLDFAVVTGHVGPCLSSAISPNWLCLETSVSNRVFGFQRALSVTADEALSIPAYNTSDNSKSQPNNSTCVHILFKVL
jgi:hypothetical protein